ncbi:hypothetical protein [Pyruvatibacter mobilis]|uniref:hypothetical protein n=1 Tax=Pyruvatibacter mobilis TaxID=1712261 RepID=UPI003BAD8DA5
MKPVREEAASFARRTIAIMKEQGMIEEPKTSEEQLAEEALEYAIGVVRAKADGTRDRLNAASLVLSYTKQKPVAKSEVAVTAAEDFLENLAQEHTDS